MAVCLEVVYDGLCQRVVREPLDGKQYMGRGVSVAEPYRIGHLGTALGESARLVEDDGIDGAGGLDAFGILDQDAAFGCAAYAHHYGCGGGQTQGAGAGYDENGHHGQNTVREALRGCEYDPCKE